MGIPKHACIPRHVFNVKSFYRERAEYDRFRIVVIKSSKISISSGSNNSLLARIPLSCVIKDCS